MLDLEASADFPDTPENSVNSWIKLHLASISSSLLPIAVLDKEGKAKKFVPGMKEDDCASFHQLISIQVQVKQTVRVLAAWLYARKLASG